MARIFLLLLTLAYAGQSLAIDEEQIQLQQDDQQRCEQQRAQDCINRCEAAGGEDCQSLCEENARNECRQAGE